MKKKIKCEICNAEVHTIQIHLKRNHPDVSLEEYMERFPNAPLLSETAKGMVMKAHNEEGDAKLSDSGDKAEMHKLFELGDVAGAKRADGSALRVTVLEQYDTDFIPDIDRNYVFDLECLKNVLMAIELNIPAYVWGHAGVGKTTLIEQIAARTNRPIIRIQHTANTEESHIVGQWTAKGGETIFEVGPLAVAMRNGWIYLADEYDFAMPSVLSVYQPVLEGKPLVIKEADIENRIIRPHPNFRFIATGNTNGAGDETSLYQGTLIQNAANYDRFHMVLEMGYMPQSLETLMLVKQSGVHKKDAEKLVDFAGRVRDKFNGSEISNPISPRALVAAARIGVMKNSYRVGLALAWGNKLPRTDREVVDGLAQRIFGA